MDTNVESLRSELRTALDTCIDRIIETNPPDGIFELSLVQSWANMHDEVGTIRVGALLCELTDGTWDVDEVTGPHTS